MKNSIAITKIALMMLMICFSIAYTVVNHTSSANRVQTIPLPYYLSNGIDYFPTGAKFKLSQEVAAMKASLDEQNAVHQTSFDTTIEPESTFAKE